MGKVCENGLFLGVFRHSREMKLLEKTTLSRDTVDFWYRRERETENAFSRPPYFLREKTKY
jgi:hypothetical protein